MMYQEISVDGPAPIMSGAGGSLGCPACSWSIPYGPRADEGKWAEFLSQYENHIAAQHPDLFTVSSRPTTAEKEANP